MREDVPIFTVPFCGSIDSLDRCEFFVIDERAGQRVCTLTAMVDAHGRVVPKDAFDWRPPFDVVRSTKVFGLALAAYDDAGDQVAIIFMDQLC